jgi:hypothetical protein
LRDLPQLLPAQSNDSTTAHAVSGATRATDG